MAYAIKWAGLLLLVALLALLGYSYLRPNPAVVNPDIVVASWDITNDDLHNSNTDLILWQNYMYLAHVSSPYHFSSDASVLHIKRSTDRGASWQEVSRFNPEGEDIRDPKFAVIGNRLFLYALKNITFNPEPYLSVYAYSDDGVSFTEFEDVPGLDGWLFWRPKTDDQQTWYNAAYWWEHGKAVLLKTIDGIHWDIVSTINEGERNDETEIEFLADHRLLALARLEYDESSLEGALGDSRAATLISVAEPPYSTWTETAQSLVTRLDGLYLFTYQGNTYAVGRYQPDRGAGGFLFAQGSSLSRKRTSLFAVREDGLAYLTDLPSAGDTSYVGLVQLGDMAYASYYTSPIDRDYPWIMGMYGATSVRMAQIDLKAMEAMAMQTPSE